MAGNIGFLGPDEAHVGVSLSQDGLGGGSCLEGPFQDGVGIEAGGHLNAREAVLHAGQEAGEVDDALAHDKALAP
jgi:hypothetical protein